MCRTAHAMLSTVICGIQMLVRVFMTTILMLENVIRMCLQTLYNFISFMLQLISLIPICCVFLVTSRMKCFMCGGGGPCPVSRGGACDCLMSLFAIIILFFIFRATGVMDKIFFNMGYAKATTKIIRFIPTTGSITECSRNDTDTEYIFYPLETTLPVLRYFYIDDETTIGEPDAPARKSFKVGPVKIQPNIEPLYDITTNSGNLRRIDGEEINTTDYDITDSTTETDVQWDWTTVLYYLS